MQQETNCQLEWGGVPNAHYRLTADEHTREIDDYTVVDLRIGNRPDDVVYLTLFAESDGPEEQRLTAPLSKRQTQHLIKILSIWEQTMGERE